MSDGAVSALVLGAHVWGSPPQDQLDHPTSVGLARRLGGRYEVVARGKPARWDLPDQVGVTYLPTGGGPAAFPVRAYRTGKQLARTLPHPAVLVTSDVLAAAVGPWLARRTGLPLVVQVQGEVVRPGPEYGGRLKRAAIGAVVRYAVRRADGVRCVNEVLRRQVAAVRGDDQVDVVGTRVDTTRFFPSRTASAGSPTVVCVAALVPVKNHDVLLHAIARVREHVPDVRLVLLGEGSRREEISRLASELDLVDAVELRGSVGHDEVASALRGATVSVLPSFSEGQPRAVLEAMASGVPVVASDLPALRAVLEDGRTGVLLAPTDVDGWARALTRLLQEPGQRRQLAQAALEHVRAAHDAETGLDRFAAFLRSVAR